MTTKSNTDSAQDAGQRVRLAAYHLIPSINHPVTCIVTAETNDLAEGQIVHVISEDGGTAVVATSKRPFLNELFEVPTGLLEVEERI